MQRMAEYQRDLIEALKNPVEAAAYLNAAIEEGDEAAFLLALRNIAAAHGVKAVAEKANMNRVSVYRALSQNGNPGIKTLFALLGCVGLRLAVEPKVS